MYPCRYIVKVCMGTFFKHLDVKEDKIFIVKKQ